jgi:hypothetical protein
VVLGAILLAVGTVALVGGREFTSVIIVGGIGGMSLLSFGFQRYPVYSYTCKSCRNTWRRSPKMGPEEGDPRYAELQIWCLSLDDIKARTNAANWLAEHPAAAAVEPLIKCLGVRRTEFADLRVAAARALKEIGDERAIQPLIDAATDTGWLYGGVRAAAISALSPFEDARIQGILEAASKDTYPPVRKAASESLAARSPAI